MKKSIVPVFSVFLLIVVSLPAVQETKPFDPLKTIPVEDLKADLQVLWDVLEEGHGGFDRYTPLSKLKESFEALGKSLTTPLTEYDFYLRILPLIEEIKDGHTRAQLSPAAEAYLDGRPVCLPLGLRFLGDKTYIVTNLSSDESLRPGAEVLAIGGIPMKEILPALLRLVSNDAGIATRKLRHLESPANFGRLFALCFERPESYRILFKSRLDEKAREVTVPGITRGEAMSLLSQRYPETARRRPLYELDIRETTAVLTIRGFVDGPEKELPPYPVFLKNAFQTLEEKKIPNLVIDLRENGGGNDHYGKLLFAYVADKPFLYYRALETKKDSFDLFRYTSLSGDEAGRLAKQVKKNSRGWFDVLGHPNLGTQQPQSPRFAGRVAILIGGLSFSATGETTSLFHYHKKAVFFGEECGAGYYGNTSGFMVMVNLPNSGIRVRVPLILYTMAVDGYPAERGIVPDFPVSPTIEDILAGRDPVMEKALAYFESKPQANGRRVTTGEKRQAVAELAKLLRARYAIPGTAETAAKTIEDKLAGGSYDSIGEARTFGEAVTEDLRAVTRDKHLKFGYSPPPYPQAGAADKPADPEAERALARAERRRGNFGLVRAEVLPGNVGYLEVRRFEPPEEAGDTIAAAVGFLANADAVIVDVRNCRGGSAYVMPIFTGYFLSRPTSLYDMVFRGDNFTERFWTAAWLPGKRLADVPMFILTSEYTFSGAEGFAYRFQVLKRATIVGETTGGGANAGGVLDCGPIFRVWMPMGRPVDADTGTNWEGTGVVPDIKTAAAEALSAAHIEALKALKTKAADDKDKARLDGALEQAEARRHPVSLSVSDLERLAGIFGPCRVWVEGGQLRVQRGNDPPYLLIPLSKTVFIAETTEPVRLEFIAGPEGAVSGIAFTDAGRVREEYRKSGVTS